MHDVTEAFSVSDAVDVLQMGYVPDMMILDLRLNGPQSSGLTVYDKLRQFAPHIPVMVITGLEEDVPLYRQAYAIAVKDPNMLILRKPINLRVVEGYIEHEFEKFSGKRNSIKVS
jgi:CheY-like chemotaxis protein